MMTSRPPRRALLLAFVVGLSMSCASDGDIDAGADEAACTGQAVACASLAGGSCDGQQGCFSGGAIGTCNGSVVPCAEIEDADECAFQEGCTPSDVDTN